MKFILGAIIAFSIFAVKMQAQQGYLFLDMNPIGGIGYEDSLKVFLLKNDSSVQQVFFCDPFFNEKLGPINTGVYSIKVYHESELLFFQRYIKIWDGRTTTVAIDAGKPGFEKYETDTISDQDMEVVLYYENGHPALNNGNKGMIKTCHSFGWGQTYYNRPFKKCRQGFSFGLNGTWAPFYKDTTLKKPGPHQRENIILVNFSLGILNQFSSLSKSGRYPLRVFRLNLGAFYNIPVICQHVVRDGHTSTRTGFIHKYTDFSLLARISWLVFTVQAEYRINDFLFSKYSQLPRWKLGVGFAIPVGD